MQHRIVDCDQHVIEPPDRVSHCPERLGAIWQRPGAGIESAVAELLFNEVFERFPGLPLVGGEVGAGWVPFFEQELDDRRRAAVQNISCHPTVTRQSVSSCGPSSHW